MKRRIEMGNEAGGGGDGIVGVEGGEREIGMKDNEEGAQGG